MKRVKLEEVTNTVSEQEIIDFKQQFDIEELPANYTDLLQQYNGGYTRDSPFFEHFCSIKYGYRTVEALLAAHRAEGINTGSPACVPIAEGWNNNPISLCLEGDNKGKIYIQYFDLGDTNPVLIAESLEALFGVEEIKELWTD